MLKEIKKNLLNYKEELQTIEKRKIFLKNEINTLENKLNNLYIFNTEEIFPIIEELINKTYNENYQYTCIKYLLTKDIYVYYFILLYNSININTLDETSLWHHISNNNIILLSTNKAKITDNLPTKISFINNKMRTKNLITYQQSQNNEINNLIKTFIDYTIESMIKEPNISYPKVLTNYLSKNKKKVKK